MQNYLLHYTSNFFKLKMDKICVILPMRGGSKGLKNKHLQKVNNKSLARITSETVRSELNDKIFFIVSTDSKEIANECCEYADLIDMRPSELGDDYISIEEVLKYTVLKNANEFEYGLYLSACDVSRPVGLIKKTFDLFFENSFDSIFWGEYTHKKYWETKNNPPTLLEGIEKLYKPRQKDSNSRVLIEHTGLGLFTRVKYWKQGLRHSGKRKILELPSNYRHIDIHSSLDLKLAETYLNNVPKIKLGI